MAVAKQRQVEGLLDIHNLILNKKPRSIVDLMDTTWKLNQAPEKVECEKRKEWRLLQLLFKESVWKNAIPNGFSVPKRF